MNDIKFVGTGDKDFPCKMILFCEEIFLQLPLLRGLKTKRSFQKEPCSSVLKPKIWAIATYLPKFP